MLGPGAGTTNPVIETLRRVQKLSGLSWDFLYWMFDIFSGLEEFMEDAEIPWCGLVAIAEAAESCESALLRKRYLLNQIPNLDAFRFRAINNRDEHWNPLVGTFNAFSLRSDRLNVWRSEDDALLSEIKHCVRTKIHVS